MSEATRDRFAELAGATGRPMSQLLDEAADALERRLFFERLTAGYETLRADKDVWRQVEAEREAESPALRDQAA